MRSFHKIEDSIGSVVKEIVSSTDKKPYFFFIGKMDNIYIKVTDSVSVCTE